MCSKEIPKGMQVKSMVRYNSLPIRTTRFKEDNTKYSTDIKYFECSNTVSEGAK